MHILIYNYAYTYIDIYTYIYIIICIIVCIIIYKLWKLMVFFQATELFYDILLGFHGVMGYPISWDVTRLDEHEDSPAKIDENRLCQRGNLIFNGNTLLYSKITIYRKLLV